MLTSIPLNNAFSQVVSVRNDKNIITSYHGVLNLRGKYTKTQEVILKQLIKVRHLPTIHHAHSTIARMSGCSTVTVKRALRVFREDGIVEWVYRHRKTNILSLTKSFFELPYVKNAMRWMKKFSLALLLSGCWVKAHVNEPGIVQYVNAKKNDPPSFNVKELYKVTVTVIDKKGGGVREAMKISKTQDPEKGMLVDRLDKIIPLTEHGRLAVMRYNTATIKEMVRCADSAMKTDNPFRYISAIAVRHSKENNLHIDYAGYHLEREKARIPKEDENFVSEIRMITMKPIPKEKSKPVSVDTPPVKNIFVMSEDSQKALDNKHEEDLKFARMQFDESMPGAHFLRPIWESVRERLRREGYVVDSEKEEAEKKEKSIKECLNEREGVCN